MIITHHPLIFSAMKKVTTDNFIGRRIIKMIQHDISYYAMHTNFDILGMADLSADFLNLKDREILKWPIVMQIGQKVLAEWKSGTENESERVCRFCKNTVKIAVCDSLWRFGKRSAESGSLYRFRKEPDKRSDWNIRQNVYVTRRCGLSFAIDAVAQDVCIIDAGHYGTEYIFMDYMEKELQALGGELEIKKCRWFILLRCCSYS